MCAFEARLQEFAEEIEEAVNLLSSLEWKDIYREKFPLTPMPYFDNMVCMAEGFVVQQDAAIQRRREWLEEIDTYHEEAEDNSAVQLSGPQVDKYGVDLDVFKNKTGKKPHSWQIFLLCLLFAVALTVHLRPQTLTSSEPYELSHGNHHQHFPHVAAKETTKNVYLGNQE